MASREQLIQFQPFQVRAAHNGNAQHIRISLGFVALAVGSVQSAVDLSFWAEFTTVKLQSLKLSEDPLSVQGDPHPTPGTAWVMLNIQNSYRLHPVPFSSRLLWGLQPHRVADPTTAGQPVPGHRRHSKQGKTPLTAWWGGVGFPSPITRRLHPTKTQ